MRAKELDTQEAPYKWLAARDARMRNIVNATRFTDAQKTRAERMKLVLEMVYASRAVHINYRKTKIAIKIDSAQVVDRVNLRALEAEWTQAGVTKTQSAQGVIYSFG